MISRVIVVIENELEMANARAIIQTLEGVLLTDTQDTYEDPPSKENTIILFAHVVWDDEKEEWRVFEEELEEAFEEVSSINTEQLIDVVYLPIRVNSENYNEENGADLCAAQVIEAIEKAIKEHNKIGHLSEIKAVLLLDMLLSSNDNIDKMRLDNSKSILSQNLFQRWTQKKRVCIPYTKYELDEIARQLWQDELEGSVPEPEQRGVIFNGYVYHDYKVKLFSALDIFEEQL